MPTQPKVTSSCPFANNTSQSVLVTRDELPKVMNANCCYNNMKSAPGLAFLEAEEGIVHQGDTPNMRFSQAEVEEESLSSVARKFIKKINQLRSRSDKERMSNFNT